MPRVHRRSLAIDELGRQSGAGLRHEVAELAVDGLGEIAGEQQGEQAPSLLVGGAGRVGELRPHGW